jgi:hypothetical protein
MFKFLLKNAVGDKKQNDETLLDLREIQHQKIAPFSLVT